MKKLVPVLALIFLLSACSYATAAPKLHRFGYNANVGVYYIDLNSIKFIPNPNSGAQDNNYVEIYELITLNSQGKANIINFRQEKGLPTPGFEDLSAQIQVVQYDVKTPMMRIVQTAWLGSKGEVLYRSKAPPGTPFNQLKPGSVGQSGLEVVLANLGNAGQKGAAKSGSGFFIAQNYVVTNYHVIANASDLKVTYKNETTLPATLVAKDQQNDLALLKVTGLEGAVKPLLMGNVREVKEGNTVYTMGYPMPDELGSRAKLSQGIINSVTGYKDDVRMFQISIPVQPGNSGGPLINSKGQVIGVVSAGMGMKFLSNTGVLPQNINYAMKISYISKLLPEDASLAAGNRQEELSATQVADVSKEAIVLITAQ